MMPLGEASMSGVRSQGTMIARELVRILRALGYSLCCPQA